MEICGRGVDKTSTKLSFTDIKLLFDGFSDFKESIPLLLSCFWHSLKS